MVNKQLIDYIKSVRKKGYSDDAIKAHLLKHNYDSTTIESAFNELSSKEKKNLKKPILIAIIAIVVLGIGVAVYMYFSGVLYSSSQVCNNVSLDLYNIQGDPVLCVFEDRTRIQMIIENTGGEHIDFVDIVVETDTETHTEKLDNLFIPDQDLITKVVYLNQPSNVKQVSITPGIFQGKLRYACNNARITYDVIPTC